MTAATSTPSAPATPRRAGSAAAPWTRLVPTRHHTVDLVGIGLLVTIALVGFRTTYYGWGWLPVGVIGVLLGLACAHVAASLRLPGLVAALGAAAAYLLLGGPIATREALVGGVLPTGQTVAGLARTAVRGWKDLLTTLPPVDPQGPLLALPFLFGLVGAATAYGIARRWAGALRALVGPGALLVLGLLLGTLTPAAALIQGVLFALVAISYAALRAARGRAPLQNGAGRTTRAVTTAVLLGIAAAGGLLVGPRLPGADDAARTVWRTAMEPPFDVAQYPSPLAGFRRYTEHNAAALYDATLFTVAGLPAGTPLRLATLDTYDGSVWGAGTTQTGVQTGGLTQPGTGSAFRRVGSHLAVSPPAGTQQEQARISVPEGGWSDVWLPTAGTVTAIGFEGPRGEALGADLRFNTDTRTGLVPARLLPGDAYRLTVWIPTDRQLPAEVPLATGALVDTQGLAFLDGRIDQWSGRETDPWRRLLAVCAVFRGTGAYTDGGPPGDYQNTFLPGHSLARITRFVKAPQLAGNDEQYAATLALVAARLGVPSRVVLGALPPADGTVKGRDVHAWVEVQRADGGWQAIPTEAFVPDRSKQPDQQDEQTDQKKTGAVVPPPAANNPPSILQGPDQAQNAATNRTQGSGRSLLDPSSWPTWLRYLLIFGGPPVVALLVFLGVVAGLKAARRRRRRRAPSTAVQLAGGWAEVVDAARDLGVPLPPAATRLEQARFLDALTGTAAPAGTVSPTGTTGPAGPVGTIRTAGTAGTAGTASTVPLARASDAAVFGADDPTPEASHAHWQRVRQAIRDLRRSVPRRRRVRALTSTRSLRHTPSLPAPTPRRTRRLPRLRTRGA